MVPRRPCRGKRLTESSVGGDTPPKSLRTPTATPTATTTPDTTATTCHATAVRPNGSIGPTHMTSLDGSTYEREGVRRERVVVERVCQC